MPTCNRIENGACRGCNVVSILWNKTQSKTDVDQTADQISRAYCPDESGGIDKYTTGTVYNYRPDNTKSEQTIW